MKLSEIIAEARKILETHGDIDAVDGYGMSIEAVKFHDQPDGPQCAFIV
jgi:hypothetical protein